MWWGWRRPQRGEEMARYASCREVSNGVPAECRGKQPVAKRQAPCSGMAAYSMSPVPGWFFSQFNEGRFTRKGMGSKRGAAESQHEPSSTKVKVLSGHHINMFNPGRYTEFCYIERCLR